jgi:general secretion pathway protein C
MMALSANAARRSFLTVVAPKLAAAGLTVLVAYHLAGLMWEVLSPARPARADVAPRLTAAQATTAPEPSPDYAAQIASLHVFGEAPREQPAQLLDAPETRLNLTLRGVYATGDEQALAIIASGGNNERFYRVGDVIAGGPTLKAVYWDRVILENNQRLETLRLPKSKDSGLQVAAEAGLSDATAAYNSNALYYEAPIDTAPTGTSPVDLGQLREQILQDPGRLADMVQAVPHKDESGQFDGYELIPQGDAQLFNQLGLQEGDVVTAVNGIAIDRPDKGLLALQDLVKAEQVSVTVLRDGTEITVEHSLQ